MLCVRLGLILVLIAMAPLARAQDGLMEGAPPPPDKRVTVANWQYPPYNRWAFQHVREILPTIAVSKGTMAPSPLDSAPRDVNGLRFDYGDGETATVADMLENTYTDGFLVLHHGKIVTEQYLNGLVPERQHLLWSVGKSFFGTLAGILAAEGKLSLDARVGDIVPELKASGWGDNSIRQVLDMQSTSAWIEDYGDANSSVRRQDASNGLLPLPEEFADLPRGNYNFLPTIGRNEEAGGVFIYKSGDTDVVGWVMERATGMRLAALLSDRIWSRLGAENDAYITVDPSGSVLASGGLNVTLRDLARFGQMILSGGMAGEARIVPAAWIQDIRQTINAEAWRKGAFTGAGYAGYRSFWWHLGNDHGAFTGRGVHGQWVYIDPAADMVIAKFSSFPDASSRDADVITRAAFHAIARSLMAD